MGALVRIGRLMLTLRRNGDRSHFQQHNQDLWLTFPPKEDAGDMDDGFGLLVALDELRLSPGAISELGACTGMEIISHVYRGTYAQEDSTGNSGVIYAGEFQRMIVGRGVRRKERNPSLTDFAHVFRITLQASEAELDSVHEQMRFPLAQRHNLLCVIASQDGRKNSLKILQDALVFSSVLDSGRHLVHELQTGRMAWVQVISGEAALQDIILRQGDGAGVMSQPSVSLTAQGETEILLVDLGPKAGYLSGSACQ